MKIGKRLLAAAVMVAMCVSMSTITVHAKEQLKDTFIEEFDPDNLKYCLLYTSPSPRDCS